ncbi:DNA repair protein RecN, partial [Streptococcus pyogenes]
ERRLEGAKKLSTELTNKVRLLKMEGATLIFQLEKTEIGSRGNSKINFNSEMNKGEGFFKVKEIASGGELSRILLALRQIL